MIQTSSSPSFRPPGTLDLRSALAPYAGPWNQRLAAHLLRRAGFGGSPADVARLASLSMNAAVDSLVHFPASDHLPAGPADLPDPEMQQRLLLQQAGLLPRRQPAAQRFPQARLRIPNPLNPGANLVIPLGGAASSAPVRQAQISDSPAQLEERKEIMQQIGMLRRRALIALQTWWLDRMIQTPAPLQEKMTLFWHGHFTSAIFQKGITPQEMLAQNQLFRSYALGNIRKLTLAVSQDPAMLKYLDNRASVKAHPNENYARELMELFTLGLGNYTEQDVRESARAFTGWTVRGPLQGGGFFFNAAQHDDGVKTFLGRTGNFDGRDIVDIIFEQPAAPRWFANKLLNYFVYNDPEPELIDAVAALIKKNDFELAPVVSTLLRSNVFYSERAYRALVKSPVEFVVGTYQLFGIRQADQVALGALNRMGQVLFYPPNVKGWDGGSAWLNSQTILARENFVNTITHSPQMDAAWLGGGYTMDPKAMSTKLVGTILQGDASPDALGKLEDYLSGAGTSALGNLSGENFEERVRSAAYLTMAMPAYQLC